MYVRTMQFDGDLNLADLVGESLDENNIEDK
jgi:hypothetical protein